MAQFLKAKFLSEALKWKADPRHASDQFFAGLRYDPYIYAQARLTFPEYNTRFPHPANKEFVENFARDLANPTKNQEILKIINPAVLTPELEAANSQFEAETRLEQQVVAETSGQPVTQPFSLTTRPAPAIPRMPAPPTIMPPATPSQPQSTAGRSSFQVPRIPATLANTVRNLGSRAGVFFQRNVGKYITAGRVAAVVSGGIGAITGGALTNGSAIGMIGGGGLGAIAPSWIRSGEGTKFLGRVGNGAINFGANLSNQVSSGATRLSMSSGSKKWALGLIGAFLLFFVFSAIGNLTGTTPPGQAGPLPPGGDGGDIGSCTFYRDDQNPPGLKFRITEWPALINEVATKVGVPASVIAGILRVESGTSFYTSDPSYITNDYDSTCSKNDMGQCNNIAYGVMQFYPPTFEGVFNRHQSELTQLFGKTSVTTQIVPQDQMAPASVFRIYSIRDQIIAAAFKIKDDAGTSPPYDKKAIDKIVTAYFTQCTYTSGGNTYNYCDAVWNSYTRCSAASGNLASCPLAGQRTITCGSYGSDPIYNASFCNGPQPEDRGHCGRTYGTYRCTPDSRRAHAIDVTATPGETVYLPTIEGKPVTWNHLGQYSISPADGGGFGHYFQAMLGLDRWILHLIHTNSDLIGFSNGKDHYESGDPVTTIAATSYPHIHVNIGKNPKAPDSGAAWLNPEDTGMCTK